MKENLFIYVDMDGVLANFDKEINAVERFAKEEGFFKKLKPISSNVVFINDLIDSHDRTPPPLNNLRCPGSHLYASQWWCLGGLIIP